MKTIGLMVIVHLVFIARTFAANISSLTDDQLLQITFDQRLNAQISTNLIFRDESGATVRLGDCLGDKPTVLILGYYGCPMLCTLVLNGVTECFRDLQWSVGDQFNVIDVSIDPNEKPLLAMAKKKTYLRSYGPRGNANGWHFLTGETNAIQTLANEIGFHYAYDPALQQYAHPSGFVVLTPAGKVAHYFLGVTYSAAELNTALRDASKKKIGSPVEQLILLCCEYSPLRGKYGHLVMDVVRGGGILMVAGLGAIIFTQQRQRIRKAK